MHLIVLADGTWNTPDQMDGDLPAPTNVVKFRNALADADAAGETQRPYYHPGVGTDGGWWNRVAGGGLGDGLDKNIMSAYNWLARNYRPDAKIWLLGFSRGAYTARSLGGMISRCGLLDATAGLKEEEIWAAVEDIFAIYRMTEDRAEAVIATAKLPFHGVKMGDACKHSMPIHFIGVWDTVGALGVPDDMALLNLIDDPSKHGFHDTDLSPVVANARHAVAMDERRQSFTPTLWTGVEAVSAVKQVWFPGSHGDVGGGYGRCGLSDATFKWMMDEAELCGLRFRDNVRSQLAPDVLGLLHDSITGVFKSLKIRPRDVPQVYNGNPLLHKSAWERQANPPLTQGDYWKTKTVLAGSPITTDIYAREYWNFTGIWLEAGVTYDLSATGAWMDSSVSATPDGTSNGKFQLGELVQMASAAFGKGESLYTRLTGNHQIDFWYTRRREADDWFALIGVVANGFVPEEEDPKVKALHVPHEEFLIGSHATFTPKKSGYLYAFANDAWQTYGNNRGSVKLTVKR